MIDSYVLQALHEQGVVDKRKIVWWQLGFEGRRIFSEEEFAANLRTVGVKVSHRCDGKPQEPRKIPYTFWTDDTVPILLRTHEFDGMDIPFFISVKPLSHEYRDVERAIKSFEKDGDYGLPPSEYLRPHIRGIASHVSERFLFWYPIKESSEWNMYETSTVSGFDGMNIMLRPISNYKFCANILKDSWSHGRRRQKKAKKFDCSKEGYEIVPFFEFDPAKHHIMVYPVSLTKKPLDLPVIVKSNPPHPPQALGVGYYYVNMDKYGNTKKGTNLVFYYEIDKRMQRLTRDTLKRDLEGILTH